MNDFEKNKSIEEKEESEKIGISDSSSIEKFEIRRENKGILKGMGFPLVIIFSFVVGGIITISLLKWTPLLNNITNSISSSSVRGKNTVYEKTSLAAAVDNIYDAVVMIESYKDEEEYSTGTGFVYKTDDKYGYVITNQHVIASCNKVVLVLSNDEEVDATVLGGDEYLDVAVMRIPKEKVIDTAKIASSDDIKIGDTIFTVGSPMGYEYRGTVTSGILSGKDRMVSVSVSNSNSSDWVMKVLQIDAAINPGNSGGPLLNVSGEVIGINSMKLVQDEIEGMGFAIPIEMAMAHVSELEKGSKIEWPMLGINMASVTDSSLLFKNRIEISSDIKEGVVVVNIVEGTGASKSDLKSGDIITKINGVKVKDSAYLRYELYKNKHGDSIEVTYIREGKEKTTKITLTKNSN